VKTDNGLPREKLLEVYGTMLLARRLDEKMLALLKQGKSFFHIGASGHEAAQVAAALALKPGYDWCYPYYRDLAFVLQLGMTPEEAMLCFLSKAEDPNSGGRQMPAHYGHQKLRIVSQSSPTGTQFLQAVGCAMGAVKEGVEEVVYVSSGEGATSEGDFHEAVNWASRDRLPVIFFIENNKYAISVPIEQQVTGASVAEMVKGYAGLKAVQVDGTNFFETYEAMTAAVERARRGEGPGLIEANLVRLLPHSSSDDQRKYRTPEELEADRRRDPIPQLAEQLVRSGVATPEELDEIQRQVRKRVDDAADWAESRPYPDASTAMQHVYASPNPGNPGGVVDEVQAPASLRRPVSRPPGERHAVETTPGEPLVMVDAINHALHEEMERNPRMLVFGEDIEDPKGGVFTATRGLSARFGRERVFNSPLAESSIVGVAIGLATRGFKPVVEIQFGDYIWTAMMQIRNELATLRYRSNNRWSCPVVIRVPVGGYIHGALYHSQNIEGFFAHLPGVYIAFPSNAADAKGLLKTAIRMEDPVLFLEHKGLYRQAVARSPEPDAHYLLPFGRAAVKREGRDITLITYGLLVYKSLEAAAQLEKEGVNVEVIDLRTINPLDKETIFASVRKTNKVLIVHEDTKTAGFGAEIAAQIAEEVFEYLDGPIRRVAMKDAFVPYNWFLEEVILPQERDIVKALRDLAAY